MSEPVKGMTDAAKGLLLLLAMMLLSAIAGSVATTYWSAGKASAAIEEASKLKVQRDDALRRASAADAKSEGLRLIAANERKAAEASGKDAAKAKAEVARLKAQRPAGQLPTPVEDAQDVEIAALETQVEHLEGAVGALQGALDAKEEANKAVRDALAAETARAEALAEALKNIPKVRPKSAGALIGQQISADGTETMAGGYVGRSFGPLHVQAVGLVNVSKPKQFILAIGGGISW